MQGKALVKQVISGDTVVIVGQAKGGPPPEKQISLSHITAPRVAFKSLTKEGADEPYGFAAREYLRTKFIGKQVDFGLESQQGDRSFGYIKLLSDGTSAALDVVTQGFAKVNIRSAKPSADEQALLAAQEEAQKAKRGIWADGEGPVREIIWGTSNEEAVASFVAANKGKKVPAVVEYVRDAGCVRALFLPTNFYCSVLLAGIQVDTFTRGEDGKEIAQPFAAEGKHFVESRILGRDLEIRVEGGSDTGGYVYGSLYHPMGQISLLLLKNGFAKLVETTARLVENPNLFREAQKEAQAKRLRKWQDYVAPSTADVREYTARVAEIFSGDCLIVQELDVPRDRRLYLASIRAPKMGGRGREDEPWAFDAKEFSRKRLIGKKVKVIVEYMREPTPSMTGANMPTPSDDLGRMHFVSIETDKGNFVEALVAQGLATPISHRIEDDRAHNYDRLVELHQQAQEKKIGLFTENAKDIPKRRFNDLVGSQNAQRARTFETSLTSKKRLDGVVDYVFNGGRFKIRCDSEHLYLSFVLAAVRCPQTARAPTGPRGGGGHPAEPFADEALAYTREQLLQREVQITVEACDRGGNFIGQLWRSPNAPSPYSVELLDLGYARCTEAWGTPQTILTKLKEAEERASSASVGVWGLPSTEGPQEVEGVVDESLTGRVSHINGIHDFYLQDAQRGLVESVQDELEKLRDNPSSEYSSPPAKNETVVAKFSLDKNWYRAKVIQRDVPAKEYKVLFIDFGNTETVHLSDIRRCPSTLLTSNRPALAKKCLLSGLLPPPDMEDDAARCLHQTTEGKVYHCKVERIDSELKRHVVLMEEEASASSKATAISVNEELVKAGLARLDKKSNTKIFSRIKKVEDAARKAHIGVWRYGDVGDEEEDDESPRAKPWGRR